MQQAGLKPKLIPRPVRVAVPVLVSFSATAYAIRDFSLNLSEGGIFLPTENMCAIGTEGELKFRVSQFDEPFVLKARVVRVVEPGQEAGGQQAGLGIQFVDMSEEHVSRLKRVVEGVSDGSVVEAIRRGLRDSGKPLDLDLRSRPIDQKMMLALNANNQEIMALIRDGNPSVMTRLLDCPRVGATHVLMMVRMPSLSTRTLSAIRKNRKFLANEEVRYRFCIHRNTVVSEAIAELRLLPQSRQRQMARDMKLRQPIRVKAQELSMPRTRIHAGRR